MTANRFRHFAILLPLHVALVTTGVGCSDEGVNPPAKPIESETIAEFALPAIKAVVETQTGERKLVAFGASDSADFAHALRSQAGGDITGPQSAPDPFAKRTMATIGVGGFGRGVEDTNAKELEQNLAPGSLLLEYAVSSCQSALRRDVDGGIADMVMEPWLISGWGENASHYVFVGSPEAANTCDGTLVLMEELLCAADRLAEIGQGLGTTVWEPLDGSMGEESAITVTIPPQATKDRFVARDIALNALAHLVQFEQRQLTWGPIDHTSCARAYRTFGNDGAANPERVSTGRSIYFDGVVQALSSMSSSEKLELGGDRIERLMNVLAGAGRLTRKLIEQGVRDDLAGAQHELAKAGDPAAGALRMWGLEPGQEPYNTLRHATRTLFGRLEIGPPIQYFDIEWTPRDTPETRHTSNRVITRDDPECTLDGSLVVGGGDVAMNALNVIGYGFGARFDDTPPRSPGQVHAMTTIDRSGIVLLPALLESKPTPGLREAIGKQLQRDAALLTGTSLTDFEGSVAGQGILAALNQVSDEDLLFGLRAAARAFQYLAADDDGASTTSEELAGVAMGAGLQVAVSPEITAQGGVVLLGGLPRSELGKDVMARAMAGAQTSSQCGMYPIPYADLDAGEATWSSLGTDVLAFQNPFFLGEVIRRRILSMAKLDQQSFASAYSVESRQWAANGMVIRRQSSANDTLDLIDVEPKDFGAADVASLGARLVLTGRSPIDAECAAGTRAQEHCPAVTMAAPTSVEDLGFVDRLAYGFEAGVERPVIRVTFNRAMMTRTLVLRPAGDKPGRVLARLRFSHDADDYIAEILSPLQRQLANEVLGFSGKDLPEQSCTNVQPLSVPSGYCLEGMKREQFVPLANELTSVGGAVEDSWKHYLSVAKEAAAKTDELARQLIETGLSKDIRQESAVEEIGSQCGGYPDVSQVTFDNGEVSLPPDDRNLQACVNEPKVDIVYLGPDLDARKTNAAIRAERCGGANTPAFCDPEADGSVHIITHAGLGLLDDQSPAEPEMPCEDLVTAFDPRASVSTNTIGRVDRPTLAALMDQQWATPTGLAATLSNSMYTERVDGQWIVTMFGKPIMGTWDLVRIQPGYNGAKINEIWPACLKDDTCTGAPATLFAKVFATPTTTTGVDPIVRDQVERAVFYMAAMAGRAPAGLFYKPLPLARLKNPDGTLTTLGTQAEVNALPGVQVPAPVVYADAKYQWIDPPAGGSVAGHYELVTPNDADGFVDDPLVLGKVFPLTAGQYGAKKLVNPAWRSDAYDLLDEHSDFAYRQTFSSQLEFHGPAGGIGEQQLTDLRQFVLDATLSMPTACNFEPASVGYGLLEMSESPLDQVQAMPPLNYTKPNELERDPFLVPWYPRPVGARVVCGEHSPNHPIFYYYTSRETDWLGIQMGLSYWKGDDSRFPFAWVNRGESPNYTSQIGIHCGVHPLPTVHPSDDECVQFQTSGYYADRRQISPSICTPEERVELFVASDLVDDCVGMETLTQALALSCQASHLPVQRTPGSAPPVLKGVDDLYEYEAWLQQLSTAVRLSVGEMVMAYLPARVIDIAKGQGDNLAATNLGAHGTQLLEMERGVRNIATGLTALSSDFRQLSIAVSKARNRIEAANLEEKAKLLQSSLQQLEIERAQALDAAHSAHGLVKAFIATASAGASSGPQAAFAVGAAASAWADVGLSSASAAINANYYRNVQENLQSGNELTAEQHLNQIQGALLELEGDSVTVFQDIQTQLGGIASALISVQQAAGVLNQQAQDVKFQLAKATGADFVSDSSGNSVPLPVNTVYRRQFDVLRERYSRTLESAKRAAYLARLAIEEKLGTRLDDLRQDLGPIEAPAIWVDDVCTAQGIDYDALRTATEGQAPDSAEELDLIKGFADQYIGDYVSKLEEVVEFYNLTYPFREGSDAAILSLREDLGPVADRCSTDSWNLLYHSGDLTAGDTRNIGTGFSFAGWATTACSTSACLTTRPRIALTDGTAPLAGAPSSTLLGDEAEHASNLRPFALPNGYGNATWLVTTTPDASAIVETAAPASVYQTVALDSHTFYSLTFWSAKRDATGGNPDAGQADVDVTATVYDAQWIPLVSRSFSPSATGWGERHRFDFQIVNGDTYHIAFSVGAEPGASVAIANVQLELMDVTGSPRAYQDTRQSRTTVTSCETQSGIDFRRRFDRECNGTECFFVLRDPLIVDTEVLNRGKGRLVGQIAKGNYNYRVGAVALNVVGTGVLDCSGLSESCYSTGYVEYDLQHLAWDVPIEDYGGRARCFNFGIGNIAGGKALAVERVLTLPLGSADRDLITQNGFLKGEYAGRPLSGSYRLRIKDSPGLSWENVEDIQVMLDYRYWSRVDTGQK